MRRWAGDVLLSWAGLLGTRGAPGKRAVLQRDSSAQEQLLCTAQQGWGHCLQGTRAAERREGDVKGGMLRADCERNLHNPEQGKSLAAGKRSCYSWCHLQICWQIPQPMGAFRRTQDSGVFLDKRKMTSSRAGITFQSCQRDKT